MIVGLQNYTRLLLLGGMLVLVPMHVSSSGVDYNQALAAAGGQGNGKGQGAEHANTNAGATGAHGNSTASAGGLAKGQTYDVNGRINALVKASSTAWQNPNSQIGKMAQALTIAFEGYLTAASLDPAALPPADLVSILATISNKQLTQADLDAIEARIAQENPDNLALQGLADPATLDPATDQALLTTLGSVDNSLISAVNGAEEIETNQGLGPIY
jgi:hypothetical protein